MVEFVKQVTCDALLNTNQDFSGVHRLQQHQGGIFPAAEGLCLDFHSEGARQGI